MHILHIQHTADIYCFSSKKDGETTQEVPLIGFGFNNFIVHVFWFLALATIEQGYAVLDEIEEVTIGDWEIKRKEVKAEHTLKRARWDLIDGWKALLVENGPNRSSNAPGMPRPPGGITSLVRD